MATLRATVVLEQLSGKAVDASRNVWHFATGSAIGTPDLTATGNFLEAFYNQISGYYSGVISRVPSAHRIEFAEVTRGGPGATDDSVSTLIATRQFGAFANRTGTFDLPSEVAIALSFRGDVAGVPEETAGGLTRPKSRRRGRVFLGPLSGTCLEAESTTNIVRLKTAVRDDIVAKYNSTLQAQISTPPGRVVHHVVYSRADGLTRPVTWAHMDNAFDTMRSRGEKGTARTNLAILQAALSP